MNGKKKHLLVYDLEKNSSIKLRHPSFTKHFKKHIENVKVSEKGEYIGMFNDRGWTGVLDGRDKQLQLEWQVNEPVNAMAFDSHSQSIYTVGQRGKVYIYDIRQGKIRHSFHDQGALSTHSVALSSNYLITGTSSGIINIYNKSSKYIYINIYNR